MVALPRMFPSFRPYASSSATRPFSAPGSLSSPSLLDRLYETEPRRATLTGSSISAPALLGAAHLLVTATAIAAGESGLDSAENRSLYQFLQCSLLQLP